ncbi:MAG: hypothetical protein ACRD0S_10740, partial [Acidimicrobiales bacterium]
LVPATHVHEHGSWTEGHARTVARERLDAALEHLADLGAEATGEVGDTRALDAVRDAVRDHPGFDEIILFTLPPGLSRWLHQDLPRRVERALGRPVTLVVTEAVPVSGDRPSRPPSAATSRTG